MRWVCGVGGPYGGGPEGLWGGCVGLWGGIGGPCGAGGVLVRPWVEVGGSYGVGGGCAGSGGWGGGCVVAGSGAVALPPPTALLHPHLLSMDPRGPPQGSVPHRQPRALLRAARHRDRVRDPPGTPPLPSMSFLSPHVPGVPVSPFVSSPYSPVSPHVPPCPLRVPPHPLLSPTSPYPPLNALTCIPPTSPPLAPLPTISCSPPPPRCSAPPRSKPLLFYFDITACASPLTLLQLQCPTTQVGPPPK